MPSLSLGSCTRLSCCPWLPLWSGFLRLLQLCAASGYLDWSMRPALWSYAAGRMNLTAAG